MPVDISVLLWEWLSFALRWVHVITGIAWIGSSFYFIALDLGLRRHATLPIGVHGEEWQVHGGGFYHIQKYLVAPEALPERLIWFKWEAYSTWLSGAALLMVVYWAGAELFLIDPNKIELEVWQAVLISAGSLTIGWLVYDALCKSGLGEKPTLLMLILFALIILMAWGYDQIFTGRAALLHLGAFTATIMSANVFFTIIPNQRIVVADLRAGRMPDAKYGKIAKLRSTHNNYLTLPVLFLMLSNHYPMAFATQYAWLIAVLIFLIGVLVRHFFNTMHAGGGRPWWALGAAFIVFLAMIWLSSGRLQAPAYDPLEESALPPAEAAFARAEGFETVYEIVQANCAMCHMREPLWPGIGHPPRGVLLESRGEVARAARSIYLQAGASNAMPPRATAFLDPSDRAEIRRWYLAAQSRRPVALAQR